VIDGVHALIFSPEPSALRAFLRDVLELPSVDAGDGWLIFALPPAELGVHPSGDEHPRHELYLMCADLDAAMARLRDKGVQFAGEVHERGFGRVVSMLAPDGQQLALYEPRHPTAVSLGG